VSIRRLLLIAFLLLTFLAAALLAALAFFAARQALAAEIGRNLDNEAAMLMEQVDMLLYERLQNVHSWSHLDIMQEARIGDVDKRLAQFLAELKHAYGGVYRDLFYVGPGDRIVAAGDPEAIGRSFAPQPAWVRAAVPNGEVFLEPLRLAPPYERPDLAIRAPVHDHYGPGDIGQFYGLFDLSQIFRLFDRAAHGVSGDRFVALLDQSGRVIAGSQGLRARGLLLRDVFAAWHPHSERSGLSVRDGAPAVDGKVLVGFAASRGYQGYAGMGWSLLVFESTEQAFHPIGLLLWLFGIAFLVTALLAGGTALAVAARIARPLIGLTAWTRRSMHRTGGYSRPEVAGALEVRELGAAFGQMVENLERSRQQLIHAAKLAVVGEMAAIMAHEVRTPLGILHTSAQMLQREPGLSPEGREMTRFILEESGRLGRLISTLLECARPRPPRMNPHDLHAVAKRVAELLTAQLRKKNLRIEWGLRAENPVIDCDEELLVQVFLNLMLNAVQFSPAGGRLGLGSDGEAAALTLFVEDEGPGIAAENRARVFDPFFTTREGGIGLGLTVTRQIVAAHGGEIHVVAGAWGGARFAVRLPRKNISNSEGEYDP
jgi:two-component system sensor histidine kinase HydH